MPAEGREGVDVLNRELQPVRAGSLRDNVVKLRSPGVQQLLLSGIEYSDPGPAGLIKGIAREEQRIAGDEDCGVGRRRVYGHKGGLEMGLQQADDLRLH